MSEDFKELFGRKHERPGDEFVSIIEKEGLVVAPGVYDAIGAQMARQIYLERRTAGEKCSYNAVYGSGWAISAMLWGYPDMGFHDLSMNSLIGKYIVSAAYPLPVIFDAETGYGSEVTLARTVEVYDEMKIALAHMEDQDASATRRCGNLSGKQCIEPNAMVNKIKSWLAVSRSIDTSMRLMVRTDALTAVGGGLQEAIERGKRYMDTDYQGLRPLVLWSDAMYDPEIIDSWIEAMRKHDPNMILGINYSPNKDWTGYYREKYKSDPPTYEQLYRNGDGFRLIWHTILQARADMEATWNTFSHMAENGAESLWELHERQRNHPVGDAQKMSNVGPWQEYEQYIGGEEASARYDNSSGYRQDGKR